MNPEDPDVQALADSIRQYGVQEPLLVSSDLWLISGHRRHAAARLAGLREVPCRVVPVRRDIDPDGFLKLLRECNRQRVKTRDELLREEVVSADPEEAYAALLDYREQQAAVKVEPMRLGQARARSRISAAKTPFLEAVQHIIEERRDFWPLSDRAVHYALLNDPPLIHASKPASRYQNHRRSYRALTDILTRARLTGEVPMEAIDDATRPTTLWDVHRNVQDFMRREQDRFLKDYWRDLQQSQPVHVEIVVEKLTVQSILRPVAMRYTLPMTVARGYASLPARHQVVQRFGDSGKDRLVVVVVSDHDPEGEDLAAAFGRSLRADFGLPEVVVHKAALTAEQARTYRLPRDFEAKTGSTRYKKFVQRYGPNVWELEALAPKDLQAELERAIEAVMDRDALNAEIAAEREDAAQLETHRRRVLAALRMSQE